ADLPQGRGLLPVLQQRRVLVDKGTVGLVRGGSQLFHYLTPGGRRRMSLGKAGRAGYQHGMNELLQVAPGDRRMTIALTDDLSLFGQADAPIDAGGRLGKNRFMGRPAAAGDGAAPAVEERQLYVVLDADLDQPLLRLV